jgi:hypothetical protein
MAAALAKERGAAFFVLFLVSADECHDGNFRYGHPELLKTSFVSLMPLCPEDPAPLRFATDEHYNAEGQRWLAAGILDFLNRDVLPAAMLSARVSAVIEPHEPRAIDPGVALGGRQAGVAQ